MVLTGSNLDILVERINSYESLGSLKDILSDEEMYSLPVRIRDAISENDRLSAWPLRGETFRGYTFCYECEFFVKSDSFVDVFSNHSSDSLYCECCEDCAVRSYYWSDCRDRFERHDESDFYDDDDEYDDDDDHLYGISDYHENRDRITDGVDWDDNRILGLEIETYVENLDCIPDSLKLCKVVAERDGSLDHHHGVEFIFAPATLDQLTPTCDIAKWAEYHRKNKTKGWNAGTGYGMHISINAKGLSDLHVGKILHFVNGNRTFCERIAGRAQNDSYFEYGCNSLAVDSKSLDYKYRAAAKRSKTRIEIRIFRSSLNFARIRRNFEFVDAIREFTRLNSYKNLNPQKFLQFINQPRNHKIYRVLREFYNLAKKPKKVSV